MIFVKFKNGRKYLFHSDVKIYGEDLDGYISEFKNLPLPARKNFLERIMNETILFSYNSFVHWKLNSSTACESMDFVRHFLYNLNQPPYEEYVYLSNFNNDNLYHELKNDPKLADTFIQHKNGLISEVIRYPLNLENLSEIKDAISKYEKSILYQEILTYCYGEPICLEV